jgi:hypothetical protein
MPLTFGFQTFIWRGPSSIGLSNTGCGHFHCVMIRKNLLTITDPVACGYSWQTLATSMAHATPPGKPMTLE